MGTTVELESSICRLGKRLVIDGGQVQNKTPIPRGTGVHWLLRTRDHLATRPPPEVMDGLLPRIRQSGKGEGCAGGGGAGRIGLRRSHLSRWNNPQMTQMGADRDVPPFRFSQARWPTSFALPPWSAIHAGVLGCADLVPHVPAQHRQSCLGCPIALIPAARLVGDGRFQHSRRHQGIQDG